MSTKKSISRIFSFLFIIVFILAVTPPQAAHGAGIRFATPGGTGDCSSWANACTLQTALTGAISGDEIWVAAGTYKPTTGTDRTATFQLIDGVAVYGGFAGTETARDQRNPALNTTILSGDIDNNDSQTPVIADPTTVTGNTTNSYHVVTGATGATLDGFTITAGNANGANPSGGGMYNSSSSPTLMNITFSGNAASDGGGMYNWSSSPKLMNVTFSDNTANTVSGNGGGMVNSTSSNPTLTNVSFSNNTAHGGGGMINSASSNPTLKNVTFSGNTGGYTGGMFNYDSSNPTLKNVTFSGNTGGFAGGMWNEDSSNPTLTNVTFSDNAATSIYYSGGIVNYDSDPIIRNTIFWGNTAGGSAGNQIDNEDSSSTPVVSDSVIENGCPAGSTCTHIITADPLLGALGNYGGSTQTIPLLAGSSAIDAGNNATCATTDQRGYVRPVDGDGNGSVICDMGAYEAGSVPPPPPAYVYLPLVQKSGPQITPTPTATPGTTTPTPTQTITPTVQPTNPPPSGPKLGTWNFTSMQLPVNYTYFTSYFYVTSNGVGYMDVTWTWVSSGGTSCKAELNATGTTHSGNTFSFMGTHFDGSGTFTSNTSASGTFNAHVDALPYYPCGSINLTNRSWSATWSSSYLP